MFVEGVVSLCHLFSAVAAHPPCLKAVIIWISRPSERCVDCMAVQIVPERPNAGRLGDISTREWPCVMVCKTTIVDLSLASEVTPHRRELKLPRPRKEDPRLSVKDEMPKDKVTSENANNEFMTIQRVGIRGVQ